MTLCPLNAATYNKVLPKQSRLRSSLAPHCTITRLPPRDVTYNGVHQYAIQRASDVLEKRHYDHDLET